VSRSRSIEVYLGELRRELAGGRRFKRRVLSEVEDHLREGARHEREGGVPDAEAERRVIERFGSPRVIASRFAEDLAGGGARAAARAFAFLAALGAGQVFAFWRARRHGRGARLPRGELPVVASATVLALAAFAASGVADTVFMFQRAAAVPGSPSPLVHAIFATVRAVITVAGGYFVVRAVLRLRSLRRLGAN
jgi:hypothetical protein